MAENVDSFAERIGVLEETVETVLRPVTDLLPPERVNSIERSGYEMERRIAALETRITELEQRTAEALQTANAMVNSRIWQALVKGSGLISRVIG
jgi:hypothetical protein